MFLYKLCRAIKSLPVGVWNMTAVVAAGAFLYTASVAWGDVSDSLIVQTAMVLLSRMVAYAVQRGVGWDRILRKVVQIGVWLSTGRPGECVVIALILWGGWSWLYPIFDRARYEAGISERSVDHLKSLGSALLVYAQDYDGTFPPEVRGSVLPTYLDGYTRTGNDGFDDPRSGRPYVWRRYLNGKQISHISNLESCVIAYSPIGFGKEKQFRAALFLDGHVKTLTEVELRRSLKVAPLPPPPNKVKPQRTGATTS